MRKTKSSCQGCHKPKKMAFRQKSSALFPYRCLKETSIKTLPKIEPERNNSMRNIPNNHVANPGHAKNFEILEMYPTKQEVTLH